MKIGSMKKEQKIERYLTIIRMLFFYVFASWCSTAPFRIKCLHVVASFPGEDFWRRCTAWIHYYGTGKSLYSSFSVRLSSVHVSAPDLNAWPRICTFAFEVIAHESCHVQGPQSSRDIKGGERSERRTTV